MFSFLASDTTTTLSFTSLTPTANSYGALIDNVSVTGSSVPDPVPEPGTVFLLGTGLAMAGVRHYRQKKLERR